MVRNVPSIKKNSMTYTYFIKQFQEPSFSNKPQNLKHPHPFPQPSAYYSIFSFTFC